MKWVLLATCVGTLAACQTAVDVENTVGQVTSVSNVRVVDVSGLAEFVEVDYTVRDREGDDLDVLVEVCDAMDVCGVAWQAPGADGTYRVTTEPFDTDVPHVFRWDTGCGRVLNGASEVVALNDALTLRISVEGGETSMASPAFTLEQLGFGELPECDQ